MKKHVLSLSLLLVSAASLRSMDISSITNELPEGSLHYTLAYVFENQVLDRFVPNTKLSDNVRPIVALVAGIKGEQLRKDANANAPKDFSDIGASAKYLIKRLASFGLTALAYRHAPVQPTDLAKQVLPNNLPASIANQVLTPLAVGVTTSIAKDVIPANLPKFLKS